MGVMFSRFKKKRTALQMLDQIESKISSIENFRQITEHRQKKIVGHLILYSVMLYIITALVFYFYFFPASLRDRLFYIIPLLTFPIIVVLLKRLVTWYYKRQITSNEEKLSDLKAEKKQMLDNVMEKETFKVAREILEKFAPDQLRKNMPLVSPVARVQPIKSSLELQPVKKDLKLIVKPKSYQVPNLPNTASYINNGENLPQRLQLARPILPKERTNIDKLVEFLVGDGPNNRYALICKNCSFHNGMALKEEFLFIAFRCCYCGYMNLARNQRPQAPRLDMKSNGSETSGVDEQPFLDSETESEEDIEKNEQVLKSNEKEEKKNDGTIRSCDEELETDKVDTDEIDTSFKAPEKSEIEKKID